MRKKVTPRAFPAAAPPPATSAADAGEANDSSWGRGDWKIAAAIAAAFYIVCMIRLDFPHKMYFDEVHHVRTAMEYLVGHDPHEWTHPPLAKLLMALSMKIAGVHFDPSDGIWKPDNSYPAGYAAAWRFPSVVFGSLALLATFALARVMFRDRLIATAATLMLALDGVFLVQSRIAMTNIHTVCFVLAAMVGTWKYVQTDKSRWLLLTGTMLGFALATRWSSLWAWGYTGLVLLWHLFRNQWPRWFAERKIVPHTALWVAVVVGTMVGIPLVIYAAAYIPFVLQGPGDWQTRLFTWGESGPVNIADAFQRNTYPGGHGWYKALSQQKDMWIYHSEIKETHPYASAWWTWPLMAWPVKYFAEDSPGWTTIIWSIGNGVLWWSSVPALLAAIHFARAEKRPALGVLALFGLGMWLCWGIQPRPLIFMHYYLECMPFACIALAYIGARWWRSGEPKAQKIVRWFCYAVAAWWIFFYPVLTAVPIPNWYFYAHIWFGWQ